MLSFVAICGECDLSGWPRPSEGQLADRFLGASVAVELSGPGTLGAEVRLLAGGDWSDLGALGGEAWAQLGAFLLAALVVLVVCL